MANSPKKSAKMRVTPKRAVTAKAKKIGAVTAPAPKVRENTKQAKLITLLRRPGGATLADLVKATGWQRHTVRGVISGALKKKLGLAVASEKAEGEDRVYRLP
jgi:hypothetical protein